MARFARITRCAYSLDVSAVDDGMIHRLERSRPTWLQGSGGCGGGDGDDGGDDDDNDDDCDDSAPELSAAATTTGC